MPLSPGRLTIGSPSSPESTDWKHVKSGEEVSFLIEERQKTRHKVGLFCHVTYNINGTVV